MNDNKLSKAALDAIAEVSNISMGAAATAISEVVQKRVTITTPNVYVSTINELQKQYPIPCVVVFVEFIKGLEGKSILVIKENDAAIIAALMMRQDPTKNLEALDEIKLSAVSEGMNQMMGASSTALSQILDTVIEISPPGVKQVDFSEDMDSKMGMDDGDDPFVVTAFRIVVEDLIDSELISVLPHSFAKQMASFLVDSVTAGKEPKVDNEKEIINQGTKTGQGDEPKTEENKNSTLVEGIEKKRDNQPGFRNLDFIKEVSLTGKVVLGRTEMTLGDLLNLHEGATVKLDRLEGELVEIVISDKCIAKGNVVVVGDHFGVRITEFINNDINQEEANHGA